MQKERLSQMVAAGRIDQQALTMLYGADITVRRSRQPFTTDRPRSLKHRSTALVLASITMQISQLKRLHPATFKIATDLLRRRHEAGYQWRPLRGSCFPQRN